MAYAAPSVADFRLRFAAFSAAADPVVAAALADAATVADASWPDTDRARAVMLKAAHDLTLGGRESGAEGKLAAAGALGFTVFRSGSLSLERAAGGGACAGSGDPLAQTSYGRELIALVRRRFPGIAVV